MKWGDAIEMDGFGLLQLLKRVVEFVPKPFSLRKLVADVGRILGIVKRIISPKNMRECFRRKTTELRK